MNTYQSYSDTELLQSFKEGDQAAYTEIYHRYKGLLYVHAYKKLGSREEARDIIQELFTVLWNKREDLDIQTNLSGYLYTAVRNRIIKQISRKQLESKYFNQIQLQPIRPDAITDHLVRENLLVQLIEKEINSLPSRMREVFLLSRKGKLSHRQIAEQLGLSESTVKKQVNNALKVLRVKLGLAMYFFF